MKNAYIEGNTARQIRDAIRNETGDIIGVNVPSMNHDGPEWY